VHDATALDYETRRAYGLRMLNDIRRVGFAGLGAMGAGITQRLLDAGYEVAGWNRTKEKAQPLLGAGMGWANTPRELAASVDLLFTMLTNTEAIEATAGGADGVLAGLREGTIWADISTIAPDASVALAERVRGTGAWFLDCPVSGSPATLAAGQTSVIVGGDRAAFEHIEEVLRAIGPKVTYVGGNGQAILTKIAINLALVVSVTALAEGVALAEKAGVDRSAVIDAVLKSVIASPVIGYRAPLLVEDTAVFADVELQQKDLVVAQDLARRLGMALPTCAAASEMLSAARNSEQADRDFFVSVHEAYRHMGGTR
jgi:3-hydroxyisobutyrate dehydrogenase-like beta-hydroxyacid dehydrogenase